MFISELVRGQFGAMDAICRKVCYVWEGDRFADNTICRRKYRRCRIEYYQNFFEDKGNVVFNALKALWNSYTAGNN